MKMDDIFNRKIIEKFDIKPEIKKLSKRKLLSLLNQLFQDEYQGKTVSFEMLEKELFVKTTSKTRKHFGFRNKKVSFKGHQTKLQLGASGEYFSLISNCQYSHSEKDKKPTQNTLHNNTKSWHYFTKIILCEGVYYQVMVDVNESKFNDLVVYNVSLNPCKSDFVLEEDVEDKNKKEGPMHSAPKLTDLRDGTSSNNIISEDKKNVNRNPKKHLEKFEKERKKKPSLDSQVEKAESKKTKSIAGDDAPGKEIR